MSKSTGALYVQGLDVALAALDKLVNAAVQEDALWAGAEVVRERAEDLAPRITGALAASIYVATEHRSDYALAAGRSSGLGDSSYALAQPVTARKGTALIAAAAIYGPMIEYQGRAFLRPALDGSHGEIVAAMERSVKASNKVLE